MLTESRFWREKKKSHSSSLNKLTERSGEILWCINISQKEKKTMHISHTHLQRPNQNVVWFEVAEDDAFPMQVCQSRCNLISYFKSQHVAEGHVTGACNRQNSKVLLFWSRGNKQQGSQVEMSWLAFALLLQNSVEAAQRGQLQGKTERVDADAHQRDNARMLQRVQHTGLLAEFGEAPKGICRLQMFHHGVWGKGQRHQGKFTLRLFGLDSSFLRSKGTNSGLTLRHLYNQRPLSEHTCWNITIHIIHAVVEKRKHSCSGLYRIVSGTDSCDWEISNDVIGCVIKLAWF